MNSILTQEKKHLLKKVGAFTNVSIDLQNAVIRDKNSLAKKVKITGKYKQSAQNTTEKIFTEYAQKIDKPKKGFIKKMKSLK